MNNYRTDGRTVEQFAKDIKESSIKELLIALRLCTWEYNKTNIWPELKPTGSDFSGELIKNNRKVHLKADYVIGNKSVEITRSDGECTRYFHEKVDKVHECIEDGSSMIFVNGLNAFAEPLFIWLTSKQLDEFTKKSIDAYGIQRQPGHKGEYVTQKKAYRYSVDWFKGMWKFLPELPEKLPKMYQKFAFAYEKN